VEKYIERSDGQDREEGMTCGDGKIEKVFLITVETQVPWLPSLRIRKQWGGDGETSRKDERDSIWGKRGRTAHEVLG